MFSYKLKNTSLLVLSLIKFIFFAVATVFLIPGVLFGIIKLWNKFDLISLYEQNITKILSLFVSILGDSLFSKTVSMILFLICVAISLVFILIMVLSAISLIWHGDCILYSFIIDSKNSMLYHYENILNKEHVEVRSGTDWLKAKFEKKTKNRKKSRWDDTYDQSYQYQKHENEENKSSYSNGEFYNDSQIELIKAMGLYMLDDLNVTEAELKSTRKKLIKTFHPDEGETMENFSQRVNSSYDLLKKHIKKKP